jgi:hypothetical protein
LHALFPIINNHIRIELTACVQVWAPRGAYLMRGITRANVMALCREHGVTLRECDFYLTQVSRGSVT